ncbi:MAG: hypothetical protein QNJ60_03845 [Xenococcaceae cyanobacterium MO_188.B19]|nr:hypothetical protein [Xenococcaceae cyanobacterium MO_188.B19]
MKYLALIPNICSSLLLLSLFNTQVLSHNIKTDGNVGVTFHIEPEHSPIAKEPSQTWFVLTRRGGTIIPLSECDCELNIYYQSSNSQSQLVQTPPLKPLSPEQYQNIPGADIIFPDAGIYDLELVGKPLNNSNFQPFSVTYSVTVSPSLVKETPTIAPESNIIASTETLEINSNTSSKLSFPLITTLLILGVTLPIGAFWWLKNKQN